MLIYSDPPQARTSRENNPTLLVCWWCTIFSMCIILFRVYGRYIRAGSLYTVDWIAFACIIPLLCRMAFTHVVLLYGTNNVVVSGLTEQEIRLRILGSKLVLVSRIFYAATLWTLKLTISEFLRGFITNASSSYPEKSLKVIRWLLFLSFMGVAIENLTGCPTFSHNWQVVPDPGSKCRQAFEQLLTMGIANIITDLFLIILPIPIILQSRMGFKMKTQLILLFSLSLLPMSVTLYRLPCIINKHGAQHFRSLMASVEILFATTAANALALGSFVRDRGPKKRKFKPHSLIQNVEPVGNLKEKIIRGWGSDNSLVRGMGLGLDPQLQPPPARLRSPTRSSIYDLRSDQPERLYEKETTSGPFYLCKRSSSPGSSSLRTGKGTLRLSNRTITSDGEPSIFDQVSPLRFEHNFSLSPLPLRRVSSAPIQSLKSHPKENEIPSHKILLVTDE